MVPGQDALARGAVPPQAGDDEGGEDDDEDERREGENEGGEPVPHAHVGPQGRVEAADVPGGAGDVEHEKLHVDEEDDGEEGSGDEPGAALGEEHRLLQGPAHGQEPLEANQHQHPVGVAVEDAGDDGGLAAGVPQVHVVEGQLVEEELQDQADGVHHGQQGDVDGGGGQGGHGQYGDDAGHVAGEAEEEDEPDGGGEDALLRRRQPQQRGVLVLRQDVEVAGVGVQRVRGGRAVVHGLVLTPPPPCLTHDTRQITIKPRRQQQQAQQSPSLYYCYY